MAHEESNLQIACVRWFRLQYPSLASLLFSVPNGGRRDRVTGAILKAEGAVAGVADLLLLVPNSYYHGLCIEMKKETYIYRPSGKPGTKGEIRRGYQSPAQMKWQSEVERQGYKYSVIRSFDDFRSLIFDYINPETLIQR